MSKRKPKKPDAFPDVPFVCETYRPLGLSDVMPFDYPNWREPTVSGNCKRACVRRYRVTVTVEKIEEPVEVLRERIEKLWRREKNFHHYEPLKQAAAEIGLALDSDDFGRDDKRMWKKP